MAFCIITISAYLFLSIMSVLDYSTPAICLERSVVKKLLIGNDKLNIVFQNLTITNGTAASLVLFGGLVLSVAFNFVSIKLSGVIPMPTYLFFPGSFPGSRAWPGNYPGYDADAYKYLGEWRADGLEMEILCTIQQRY